MSLLQEYMEPCRLIEKKRVPDGEGGFATTWADGAEFAAAIILDNSMQARIAEKQGITSVYTVTAPKTAPLEYHDVFRRLSDGQVFRVTSNGKDVETPERATFRFSQATAEKWDIPKEAGV